MDLLLLRFSVDEKGGKNWHPAWIAKLILNSRASVHSTSKNKNRETRNGLEAGDNKVSVVP